jgi:lysozyme
MKTSAVWNVLLTSAVLWAGATGARADDQPLSDEPSRGDLFRMFVRGAAGGEALLPGSFSFPTDTRDNEIFGIDISHYTESGCKCQIDWTGVAPQKVFFVYLKASQGTTFVDAAFARNWTALQAYPNIRRGAYHFLSASVDPSAQAEHFLDKLGTLQPGDMPPGVDLEWDQPAGQTHDLWADVAPDDILDRVQAWLEVVELATGRLPMIYTNAGWWSQRVKDDTKFARFARYPIWIADYSPSGRGQEVPKVPDRQSWAIWQFTDSGVLAKGGVPGRLDVSVFKGTMPQFVQTFGLPAN